MTDAPIGVFDSGVGGLTVARAMMDMMPHESIHYVGDTLNGPYGPLPIADVRRHALTIYDAQYLELALRRQIPLATFDQQLAGAARAEGLTVLP